MNYIKRCLNAALQSCDTIGLISDEAHNPPTPHPAGAASIVGVLKFRYLGERGPLARKWKARRLASIRGDDTNKVGGTAPDGSAKW